MPFKILLKCECFKGNGGNLLTLRIPLLISMQKKAKREKDLENFYRKKKKGRLRGMKGNTSGKWETLCIYSLLLTPISYLLVFRMHIIFSPLGSINGWPHLFYWKYTSSWFWNIGKYALSFPPSQKVAQYLRLLSMKCQETGNNGKRTGICATNVIRSLSLYMPVGHFCELSNMGFSHILCRTSHTW